MCCLLLLEIISRVNGRYTRNSNHNPNQTEVYLPNRCHNFKSKLHPAPLLQFNRQRLPKRNRVLRKCKYFALNTLSDTQNWDFNPKRYDEHPSPCWYGNPLSPPPPPLPSTGLVLAWPLIDKCHFRLHGIAIAVKASPAAVYTKKSY